MGAKKGQSAGKADKAMGTGSSREDKTRSKDDEVKTTLPFPVVGIGASAGGLEALQPFFENITTEPGAAFVFIQHLSPDHHSYMVDLLSRHTFLPVSFIEDGMRMEPNHIYLIPPKVNIVIKDGVLYFKPIVGRGLNLPIDIFFLSLAEDQKSNAVAIIMSGAGSDGTLGIRAVKEFGGITMVQDPVDAHFDGMPRSALGTNMVDMVLPAASLAHELISYLEHSRYFHPNKSHGLVADNQTLYNQILSILKQAKKVDFSSYRQETIIRRLEKRVSLNRFDKLADYVKFLTATPKEVDTLYYEILIGVTRFFRDPDAFNALEEHCFPTMFRNVTDNELRVWVASCSTGEEAYSIAILLKEYMLKNHIAVNVKIFATDIDDRSLKFASQGIYPQNVVSDVPTQYLAKYFSPNNRGYQVCSDIRNMIIFATQDLIANPPFFRLDLVTCRNFLIYIHSEAQKKVLSSFYVGLNTGGVLFLGPSESLDELSRAFETVSTKYKIFKKKDGYTPDYSPKLAMPLHLTLLENSHAEAIGNLSQVNSELLTVLEQVGNSFLPPSLITDSENNIIYAVRDAGKLMHVSSGRVTTNLLDILPKDLSLIVSSLIRRAKGREEIVSSEILFDGRPTLVRCKHIVSKSSNATYYYITFEEKIDLKKALTAPESKSSLTDLSSRYQERIDELEYELNRQKESLRVAVEQLETSNEELQASNEELVASNEELQSSNEELQSVNEELYTVNIEHVHKLEEITQLNNDYDNLLSNTQIGTLFLDTGLVIRKISVIAGKILNILPSDAGKPLGYFSLGRIYPQFLKDVERVNSTKKAIEKEVVFQKNTYWMRIVPYFTDEKVIKGVIITFVDLTDCKMRALKEAYASQEDVRNSTAQLEAATTIAQLAYFKINARTRKSTGSELFSELWPIKNGCVVPLEKWIEPEDLAEVKARYDDLCREKITQTLLTFRSRYFGELRYYRLSASVSTSPAGEKIVNGVIQNITQMIQTQLQKEAQEQFWDNSINAIPGLFYAKDADNDYRYLFANRYFYEFTGQNAKNVIGKTDEEITTYGKQFLAEDEQVLQCNAPMSFENEALAADGSVRYFHTTKWLDTGADGRRMIVAIGSDVTAQRLLTQDLQAANRCLSALVDSDDLNTVMNEIMESLCERLGASHCFLMSFDHETMTTRCEYESALGESVKIPVFDKLGAMPFSEQNWWYQRYQEDEIVDVPDITVSKEAIGIFKKYYGYPKKLKAKSLYSVSFRNKGVVQGSVCFVYTRERPAISQERLQYLMSFASNLFRNIFLRQNKTASE